MQKELNKRELQAIETKEKLLKASKYLIVKHGYNNVSVSQICKECSVAKGTFYIYFNSKKDIIIEILSDVNIEMFSHQWNKNLDCKGQLYEYIEVYLYTINSQGVDFTREILKVMIDERFDAKAVSANKHVNLVERILKEGQKNNEIDKNINIQLLRRTLQNLIFGTMIDWCANEGEPAIPELGESIIKDFISLYIAK